MASDDNDRAKEHFRRGLEKFEDDDYDGAIAEFNESLRFSPRLVPVLNIHGLCWALKDEQDKAIRDFNEAIGSDPCDPHTWSNRGNSWGRANTTRRFWTMTKRSGLDSHIAHFWKNRGNARKDNGDIERAISGILTWTIGMMLCR